MTHSPFNSDQICPDGTVFGRSQSQFFPFDRAASVCVQAPAHPAGLGRLYAYTSVRFPLALGNDQHPVPDCSRCTGKDDPLQKFVALQSGRITLRFSGSAPAPSVATVVS